MSPSFLRNTHVACQYYSRPPAISLRTMLYVHSMNLPRHRVDFKRSSAIEGFVSIPRTEKATSVAYNIGVLGDAKNNFHYLA